MTRPMGACVCKDPTKAKNGTGVCMLQGSKPFWMRRILGCKGKQKGMTKEIWSYFECGAEN